MYVDLLTIPKFTLGAWAKTSKLGFGTLEMLFFGVDITSRLATKQAVNFEQETVMELLVDQVMFLLGYYFAPQQFKYYGWVTLASFSAYIATQKKKKKRWPRPEDFEVEDSLSGWQELESGEEMVSGESGESFDSINTPLDTSTTPAQPEIQYDQLGRQVISADERLKRIYEGYFPPGGR